MTRELPTAARLAAFAAALAAAFGVAYGVGSAAGPLTSAPAPAVHDSTPSGH